MDQIKKVLEKIQLHDQERCPQKSSISKLIRKELEVVKVLQDKENK